MLYNLLLVLLIIDGLLLALVVMLQAGQGGGLASLGGGTTDMVLGGRQAVTILTKATWITGGAFIGISFLLSIAATNRRAGETEVQRRLRAAPQTQAPQPAPLQVTPAPPPVQSTPDSGR
jgi:preprotein translocase subunit SecG